jgi:hypothetical protein
MPDEIPGDPPDVGGEPPWKQEAIVKLGSPAHERSGVGLGPEHGHERSHEQRLNQRHLRVRGHLETAQLDHSEAPVLGLRAEQLVDAELGPVGVAGEVDEQAAEQTVDLPGRHLALAFDGEAIEFGKRRLELVQALVARFVDARRLARRPDEATREQVRQRRVVLPIGDQAP